MTASRLELDAPDLVEQLKRLQAPQLRRVAIGAARVALEHAGVQNPILEEALRTLDEGHSVSEELRSKVEEVVNELDDRYFELQEAEGHFQKEHGPSAQAYCRARAANAVLFAVHHDPFEAAMEALYEANYALDEDTDLLRGLVRQLTTTLES